MRLAGVLKNESMMLSSLKYKTTGVVKRHCLDEIEELKLKKIEQ